MDYLLILVKSQVFVLVNADTRSLVTSSCGQVKRLVSQIQFQVIDALQEGKGYQGRSGIRGRWMRQSAVAR